MPDFIAILDFLENNHGKEYKKPENCEGEEKSRNIVLKNAGKIIGDELKKISNSCFEKYRLKNVGSIKWQENNGKYQPNKIKEYLWLHMKYEYEYAIQYPFGIALFAEIADNHARFRVSFEIKTKGVIQEDLDRYHLHLNKPKEDDMVYFAGNYEIGDLITVNKDVNEIKTDILDGRYKRVQVSLCINKDGTKTNEQYEQEINDAIAKLLPYYEYVLGKEDKMNNEKKQEIKRHLMNSKNIILHGAPGTGKSYLAKQIATDIVSDGRTSIYSELTPDEKKQIEFVQFHPSYDYSDFVEALRPKLNDDGSMGFELKEGIFMKFVNQARKNYEDSQKTIETIEREQSVQDSMSKFFEKVWQKEMRFKTVNGNEFIITSVDDKHINISIPGNATTNKLSLKIDEVRRMLESGKDFNKIKDVTSFFAKRNATQNFSYDFVIYNEIKKMKSSKPIKASVEALKKYVFIIDEINRGEISKVFGELFYSIDPGYRGKAGEISTQYANLHEDPEEKFYVPDNVYIIGTMNDIDRSVDSFDFAMRRRFRFIELKADEMTGMLDSLETKREDAEARMKRLNESIIKFKGEGLNENYQIGAAYFLKLDEINVDQLWSDYLEPLLKDYIQGMPNEEEKLESFKDAYYGNIMPNEVNADANSEG